MSGDGILARTARGAGWVVAWRMATRLLGLVSTLALVRLLAPEDFGLVAIATGFWMALEVCLSIGVEDQIVRSRDPTRALYDTAFTFNLLRGAALAAAIALAAGPVGAWFDEPRLEPVLLALAGIALLNGFVNIGTAEFRRDIAFDKEFLLQMLPRLVSVVVTVGAAAVWHSHWALIAGIASNRVLTVALGYAMHPYRPRLSLAAWRELAGVSVWSWALGVVGMLGMRADTIVLGRVLGTAPAGVYSAALEIAATPTTELVAPVARAAMPGFAATLREGDGDAARTWLRIQALTALMVLPAGFGVSLVAGPLVALALGQAWLEAVPVVQILAVAYAGTLFGFVCSALLMAQARLRLLTGLTAISALVKIGLLIALVPPFGLTGAAVAVAVAFLLDQVLLLGAAMPRLGLRFGQLARQVWRVFAACGVMCLLLWTCGLGWAPAPPDTVGALRPLLGGIALGMVAYAGALGGLWLLAGRPDGAERDVLTILGRVLGTVRNRLGARWFRPSLAVPR